MPSPRHDPLRTLDDGRWPPLLLALRRAARPDRARVAAYLSLTRRPAGWTAYTDFLAVHRSWLASLDRVLAQAGVAATGPLPDAAVPDRDAVEPTSPEMAPPGGRAHALGYLYVFEAFRLGCAVLERRIRGLAEQPLDAVQPVEKVSGPHWNQLVQALEQVPPEEHPAVIQGAQEAFSAWEQRLAGSLAHLGLGPLSTDAHAA